MEQTAGKLIRTLTKLNPRFLTSTDSLKTAVDRGNTEVYKISFPITPLKLAFEAWTTELSNEVNSVYRKQFSVLW